VGVPLVFRRRVYLTDMSSETILVKLRPYAIEAGETFLLDAALTGLRALGCTEVSMSCLGVQIIDAPDATPLILMPGFVDFAKKVHAAHPDLAFFADLSGDFYRSVIMALSGDLTAVQSGDQGKVYVKGDHYLTQAMNEVDRLEAIGSKHQIPSHVLETHCEDLTEYFLEKELES